MNTKFFGSLVVVSLVSAMVVGCGTSEDETLDGASPATSAGGTGGSAGAPVDNDDDGFTTVSDCNDNDPNINPAAKEDCDNGIDDDCDGKIDSADSDCASGPVDKDNDGYTYPGPDCDDNDPNVHPGAPEDCDDGKDNDCDGKIDGADTECGAQPVDNDCDGATSAVDCNDNDPDMYPGNTEDCDDGKDNDCDGDIDSKDSECQGGYHTYFPDGDGDGFGDKNSSGIVSSSNPGNGYVLDHTDCDDNHGDVNPGEDEVCGNNRDDDCDGNIDEGCTATCNNGDQQVCDCPNSTETGTQTCTNGSWGACEGCSTTAGEDEVVVILSDTPSWVVAQPEIQMWYEQYSTGETGLVGCTHPSYGNTTCTFKLRIDQAQSFEGQFHLYGNPPTAKYWGDVSGDVVRANNPSDRMACMSQAQLDAQNGQTHLDANGRVEVKVDGVKVALRFQHNPYPKLPSCEYCCAESPSYPYQNFVNF